MQFKVPQFLEIEDKIFGPFTFREFVYLAGGAGLCFTIYKLLGLALSIIPILVVAGIALALTFYRPNNKPFLNMVESGFKYFTQSKLYIWKKEKNKKTHNQLQSTDKTSEKFGSRLSSSKLKDLAWSLNVLDLNKQKDNTQ
ncbi:MAG: PrgI family protein [Candidatus Paceibacterota bacterium]